MIQMISNDSDDSIISIMSLVLQSAASMLGSKVQFALPKENVCMKT